MKAIALSALFLAHSCGSHRAWHHEFISQLRCGMHPSEVQALTGRKIVPTSSKPDLGTHRVDGHWSDVWLSFPENRLTSVISGSINGQSSVRLSPKNNLCTGQLTFFVSLEWVMQVQGADVFLDNKLIQEAGDSGMIFEVPAGDHEIRIVKSGYKPVVKHLSLGPADEGRIDVLVTASDLHPSSGN